MQNYREFSRKSLVPIIIICLILGCSGKSVSYYNNIGINYIESGNYEDAISAFRKSIKLNPANAETHFNLGRAYKRNRVEEKAKSEFSISFNIDPVVFNACVDKYGEVIDYELKDPQQLSNLASAYAEKGMLDEAINAYKEAMETELEDARLHYSLGTVYSKKGMHDGAINEFKRAIELNHDMPEAHYNLGLVYYKQEKFEMAIDEYRLTLNILPEARSRKRASVYYKLGLAYNDNGTYNDAIDVLQKAVEITPNDKKFHYKLSMIYKEHGMFDLAEKEMEIYKKLKKK